MSKYRQFVIGAFSLAALILETFMTASSSAVVSHGVNVLTIR